MPLLSSEGRFSFYYAAMFGPSGATGPFAALWMSHAGLSPSLIGIIAEVSLMCLCCLCGAATLAISYQFSFEVLPC